MKTNLFLLYSFIRNINLLILCAIDSSQFSNCSPFSGAMTTATGFRPNYSHAPIFGEMPLPLKRLICPQIQKVFDSDTRMKFFKDFSENFVCGVTRFHSYLLMNSKMTPKPLKCPPPMMLFVLPTELWIA